MYNFYYLLCRIYFQCSILKNHAPLSENFFLGYHRRSLQYPPAVIALARNRIRRFLGNDDAILVIVCINSAIRLIHAIWVKIVELKTVLISGEAFKNHKSRCATPLDVSDPEAKRCINRKDHEYKSLFSIISLWLLSNKKCYFACKSDNTVYSLDNVFLMKYMRMTNKVVAVNFGQTNSKYVIVFWNHAPRSFGSYRLLLAFREYHSMRGRPEADIAPEVGQIRCGMTSENPYGRVSSNYAI